MESELEESKTVLEKYFELEKGKKVSFYFPRIKSRRKELLEMALENLNRYQNVFIN